MRRRARVLALALPLLLAACGEHQASSAASAPGIRPADATLAQLYDQSCGLCHSQAGNPAPQAGDAAAWAPRLAKGEAQLLASTLGGYGGMPALGQCMDCSEAEFRALIRFMALREGAAPAAP